MRIAICGSINFAYEMKELAEKLKPLGFEVELPATAVKVISGELSVEDIRKEKESGKFSERSIRQDSIRTHWEVLRRSDMVLVANYEKNGVKGYVGGNAFLEMGFAHILNKPVFLLFEIPDMAYADEIKAMQPTVLKGDLRKIAKR